MNDIEKQLRLEIRKLIQEEQRRERRPGESHEYPGEEIEKDLAAAFKMGPEGVRAFFDSQKGKDPKVREVLQQASEQYDGASEDDQIAISSPSPVNVSNLRPTQQFIDLMQSVSFPLGSAAVLDSAITSQTTGAPGAISISGNALLDGHHRWSGVYAITPKGTVSAQDFDFPGSVKEKLAAAQMSVAAVNKNPGAGQPSKGGAAATDIIGKSKDAILTMIDKNKGNQTDPDAPGPLLNDKMIQDIAAGAYPSILKWAGLSGKEEFVSLADSGSDFANDPIRKAIAEKVAANLDDLPQPLSGAPKSREDMPQMDHPQIGGKDGLKKIATDLPAGELNVSPPFDLPEGSQKEDHLIMERWQKLAGIREAAGDHWLPISDSIAQKFENGLNSWLYDKITVEHEEGRTYMIKGVDAASVPEVMEEIQKFDAVSFEYELGSGGRRDIAVRIG